MGTPTSLARGNHDVIPIWASIAPIAAVGSDLLLLGIHHSLPQHGARTPLPLNPPEVLYVEFFILPLEEFFATLGDLGDINISAPHLVCVDVDVPAFTSGRNECNIEVEDLEIGNASGIIFDNSLPRNTLEFVASSPRRLVCH